jgi:hypothetical protein
LKSVEAFQAYANKEAASGSRAFLNSASLTEIQGRARKKARRRTRKR